MFEILIEIMGYSLFYKLFCVRIPLNAERHIIQMITYLFECENYIVVKMCHWQINYFSLAIYGRIVEFQSNVNEYICTARTQRYRIKAIELVCLRQYKCLFVFFSLFAFLLHFFVFSSRSAYKLMFLLIESRSRFFCVRFLFVTICFTVMCIVYLVSNHYSFCV